MKPQANGKKKQRILHYITDKDKNVFVDIRTMFLQIILALIFLLFLFYFLLNVLC